MKTRPPSATAPLAIVEDDSLTNSSLACARRCLTEYDLRYNMRLEPIPRVGEEDENDPLDVGTAWHKAHEAFGLASLSPEEDYAPGQASTAAYDAIAKHAPSDLWREKLRRLFAAHAWYWQSQPFKVLEPESEFDVVFEGNRYRGKTDGVIQIPDKRIGILEIKTSSDGVEDGSSYWDRLRLDVQVGLYAITRERLPDFILYDVTSKPTIRPKSITKADVTRMRAEIQKHGFATYFGEKFTPDQAEPAIEAAQESIAFYGARLTSDIGNEPQSYFARREVPRTVRDFETLKDNLRQQVALLRFAEQNGLMHRNPESCTVSHRRCDFLGLCSTNTRPTTADKKLPAGFQRRAQKHVELSS